MATLQLPCSAGDTIPFPKLLEGQWESTFNDVGSDGQMSQAPRTFVMCVLPTANMQRAVERLRDEESCKHRVIASDTNSVTYALTCPKQDGDTHTVVTVTALDERHYRMTVKTEEGSSEATNRWLGQCKTGTEKSE
ncbi:DUF3617 family protein [Massilia sp. Se16.2.3]|uniref:DUF3617 domain-containing protein n=1 Tax=Massilia sp. Se16.2.3 TaxID=2709303 RepID=UPI0016023B93|nr:DUF3617 family protein [Massilia sp. Se16.2.3]QNA99632.1 DUF3617 family protein [Massilia sp. Se16.2.3]